MRPVVVMECIRPLPFRPRLTKSLVLSAAVMKNDNEKGNEDVRSDFMRLGSAPIACSSMRFGTFQVCHFVTRLKSPIPQCSGKPNPAFTHLESYTRSTTHEDSQTPRRAHRQRSGPRLHGHVRILRRKQRRRIHLHYPPRDRTPFSIPPTSMALTPTRNW
jgi:hypothetical protein